MNMAELTAAARRAWAQTFDEQDDWSCVFAERRTLDRTPAYSWLEPHAADHHAWLTAAATGDAAAQWLAGLWAQYGLDDPTQAAMWYEKAASQGDDMAAFALSQLLDGDRQIAWLRYAAERGNARAQLTLSRHCAQGDGVMQSDVASLLWLQQAAANGYSQAQFTLATRLYFGDGMEKDEAAARDWCQRAAAQGHVAAAQQLAEWQQQAK